MNKSNNRLIGGKFGLPELFLTKPCMPSFLTGDPILFFNARSGIKLIVDQLKPRKVWFPSYLCPSMITAIDKKISKISYYPLTEHLSIIYDDLLSDIQPDDLFICIDYFGFQCDQNTLEQVKQCGCKILRDCSQALFFDFQKDNICDYHLFSPRKFLGVTDGGILHANTNDRLSMKQLTPPDQESFALLLQAAIMRREFDLYGINREWYGFFKNGESLLRPGTAAMSELTRVLLRLGFDYVTIQSQRRKNYLALLQKLKDFSLFPSLPDDVVPLGFPVVLPNRDVVRDRLYENEIFPPIHWDIRDTVPMKFKESHKLAEHIMTLPCDQRYDEEDMGFMGDCFIRMVN